MADKRQSGAKQAITAEARNTRQRRMTDGLAHVVALMMRDRRFRDLRIADLDWLVMPPILTGQYKIAQGTLPDSKEGEASQSGRLFPVAAALWACVSPEVDARLTGNPEKPMLLKPAEWKCGDIMWLVAMPGQPAYVRQLLEHLQATTFKGKVVKIRTVDKNGKPSVRILDTRAGKG